VNLFFFFFRSAWLRDLTHFVYARVKEKELERSDGVLLFLPLIERSASHSFRFFSFFVCFFLFDERIFVFVREWRERSRIFVTERRKKDGIKEKKGVGMGRKTNKFYLSLKEQILYRIIFHDR